MMQYRKYNNIPFDTDNNNNNPTYFSIFILGLMNNKTFLSMPHTSIDDGDQISGCELQSDSLNKVLRVCLIYTQIL
jgi:hypothetical protein